MYFLNFPALLEKMQHYTQFKALYIYHKSNHRDSTSPAVKSICERFHPSFLQSYPVTAKADMIDYDISNWMIQNCSIQCSSTHWFPHSQLNVRNIPLGDCNFLFHLEPGQHQGSISFSGVLLKVQINELILWLVVTLDIGRAASALTFSSSPQRCSGQVCLCEWQVSFRLVSLHSCRL